MSSVSAPAPLVAPLPDGALDIVGDVHGELEALESLLSHLGYDSAGRHPDGRSIVFVGDLCDRGPDSPGVVRRVRTLVEAGRALAVLGNHELNLLRGDRKDGNDWFWSEGRHRDARYEPRVHVQPHQREEVLAFFRGLPLALERPDLRVVHAAWHHEAIHRLRAEPAGSLPVDVFDRWERATQQSIHATGLGERAAAERAAFADLLHEPARRPPMLQAAARADALGQMSNPVRVATSGLERVAREPFFAAGAWRFVERVRWWEDYRDPVPVVVGHYWRQFVTGQARARGAGDANLFDQLRATEWHGVCANVYCVDFSAGGRWRERPLREGLPPSTRLGALRWPERTLVVDTGEHLPTVAGDP